MKYATALLATLFALQLSTAQAETTTRTIQYEIDGTTFESTLVHSGSASGKPGILMIPNWLGPTEASLQKAKQIAGDDYIVLMADMYGLNTRPTNGKEAGQAAGAVRADRTLMRARAAKALEILKTEGLAAGLDPQKTAAIGFCFGGGTVLELGRSAAELDAVVSFHGDLLSPTLAADAAQTKAKVLVLHGADDPYVPQEHVATFIATMQATDVDWQLVQYSGAVHSFTDPNADSDGARYHATSAKRSFAAMRALFDELWSK